MELTTDPIDVVVSFDTTGSMSSVLAQVRHNIKQMVERLMGELPEIHIGIIVHGDYCDEHSTYVTRHLDLTQDTGSITDFVEHTPPTSGGDAPECYELVLHEAQELSWRPDAKRILVLIGDDVAHAPEDNPQHQRASVSAGGLDRRSCPLSPRAGARVGHLCLQTRADPAPAGSGSVLGRDLRYRGD